MSIQKSAIGKDAPHQQIHAPRPARKGGITEKDGDGESIPEEISRQEKVLHKT